MDKTNYEYLKDYGFSPAKAAEIALDAKRGDKYACQFVRLAHARDGSILA